MNDNTTDMPPQDDGSPTRPLGFWLRAVDGLLTREFATALAQEGIGRREWMILNVLDGTVDAPHLAEGIQRGKKVRALVDRGWVEEAEDSWRLTDAGREAKARLGIAVDGIRSRVAGAVGPEAFATTLASLESIARELGWDETRPMPSGADFRHGRRRGRGFGPGFGRGFIGRGFGPGFGPGSGSEPTPGDADGDGPGGFGRGFGPHRFGPGFGPREMHGECGHPSGAHRGGRHGHGDSHRHGHGERHAEHAYERGFDAGYRRARDERDA
ncbi:MAG: hypothetical protein EOO67_03860 [Microbacterium sp.]|nr:MAG: hypothetical protein EOO67_03860 [Microbacterium sp.]